MSKLDEKPAELNRLNPPQDESDGPTWHVAWELRVALAHGSRCIQHGCDLVGLLAAIDAEIEKANSHKAVDLLNMARDQRSPILEAAAVKAESAGLYGPPADNEGGG